MATEFTDDEIDQLVTHLKTLGVKPKMDTAEDFQQWMKDYVIATAVDDDDTGKEEEEEEVETDRKDPVKPFNIHPLATISQLPRLSTFSGESSKADAPFDLWKYEVKWDTYAMDAESAWIM